MPSWKACDRQEKKRDITINRLATLRKRTHSNGTQLLLPLHRSSISLEQFLLPAASPGSVVAALPPRRSRPPASALPCIPFPARIKKQWMRNKYKCMKQAVATTRPRFDKMVEVHTSSAHKMIITASFRELSKTGEVGVGVESNVQSTISSSRAKSKLRLEQFTTCAKYARQNPLTTVYVGALTTSRKVCCSHGDPDFSVQLENKMPEKCSKHSVRVCKDRLLCRNTNTKLDLHFLWYIIPVRALKSTGSTLVVPRSVSPAVRALLSTHGIHRPTSTPAKHSCRQGRKNNDNKPSARQAHERFARCSTTFANATVLG